MIFKIKVTGSGSRIELVESLKLLAQVIEQESDGFLDGDFYEDEIISAEIDEVDN
jgi:hypothetical protein